MRRLQRPRKQFLDIRDASDFDFPGILDIGTADAVGYNNEDYWQRRFNHKNRYWIVAKRHSSHLVGPFPGPVLAFACLGYKTCYNGTIRGDSLYLLDIIVHPHCRKQRIGFHMMSHILTLMRETHFSRMIAYVRETNLPVQLFLRSLGFRAVRGKKMLIRQYFSDTGEDCIVMRLPDEGLTII